MKILLQTDLILEDNLSKELETAFKTAKVISMSDAAKEFMFTLPEEKKEEAYAVNLLKGYIRAEEALETIINLYKEKKHTIVVGTVLSKIPFDMVLKYETKADLPSILYKKSVNLAELSIHEPEFVFHKKENLIELLGGLSWH